MKGFNVLDSGPLVILVLPWRENVECDSFSSNEQKLETKFQDLEL